MECEAVKFSRGLATIPNIEVKLLCMKMEPARVSKTLVKICQPTRPPVSEDSNIQSHRRENLKSHIDWIHLAHYRVLVVRFCEYGNETSGSMRGREFF
jgi:hypothetical protein